MEQDVRENGKNITDIKFDDSKCYVKSDIEIETNGIPEEVQGMSKNDLRRVVIFLLLIVNIFQLCSCNFVWTVIVHSLYIFRLKHYEI